ncbi:hypothetical protein E8E12_008429 [Didymella heteroderae]|uniref:Apple domain-containing protein n=1 Tax=Didymella heteroderae TaxID=1769908 RepID=A0A9P4WV64_9PLEO|nr:hypothetical protein E8E12_008429 [Didymella heteroderae]
MFFTRSVLASAAVLSFSATAEGSVLHRKAEEHIEVKRVAADDAQGAWTWKRLFGKRQNLILDCPNDQFASLLDSAPNNDVQGFCNDWLNLDPATVTNEVTPTVTVTTSASTTTTQTTVQRTILTSTVVETATVTASASVRRRMVAAAQVEAIATSIVASVIASGTPTSSTAATTKGAARLAAEEGLSTACSCKQVAPTSTVTDDFTVPAVKTTTVGVRVLNIIRETETRTYTSTTTITESATATASGDATSATSSTDSVSSRADAEASSSAAADSLASVIAEVKSSADAASTDAAAESGSSSSSSVEESSSAPAITTVPIAVTSIGLGNATATVSGSAAVVTAIPFSCDEDDINKDIDQVVGGFRLGYSVYCNTGLTSQDRVGRPIPVTDATSCAAQCSLLNSQGAQDACQSAVFTPSNSTDATGGTCELYTAAENSGLTTTPAPGSVAIVHTGTYANGDECAALNATTAAIIPTITDGPVVIETPGLVTQSSGGGVSRTYVSANTTDASGFVHFSWYEIYASSANWYAVYETSWACSATITRTIEQEPSTTVIQGSTITSVIVTTIIGNGFTTIISGDSTTTIRGGGGAGGATFVPASTTGGDAGLTTFFSTAVQASTGTDGIVTPTPAPSLGGVGNVTVTEGFTSVFSTGSEGIISPSASPPLNASISGSASEEVVVSSTATTLTISGANSTFFSAGSNGILTPTETPILETIVSSGTITLTLSGSNATATSTGGSGVIPPSASGSASESSAVASTSSDEWDDENSYGPKTSRVVVISSSILTITSTGTGGVETPILSTAVSSETLIVEISNTTLSGNGSLTTATSVATFNSTGSGGILTPTVVTEVITTATGVSNFTSIIATATANSTGGAGVIPPGGTLVVTEVVNSTLPIPTPTGGFSTGGSGNFSTGGETAITISTGSSGVIPPAPTNSTSSGPPFTNSDDNRTGFFSRSTATVTSNFTASSGFATPSSNLTTAIETPSSNTTVVLTVPLSTGPVSTAPANATSSFSVSFPEDNRSGSYSTTSTLTLPVETTTPPTASQTPSTLVVTATTNITLSLPSGNVTLIPPTTRPFDNTTAPLPTPTGNITFPPLVSINYSTVPSFSTGNLSTILPPSSTGNITLIIPSPTTNVTIIVETPFVPSNSTTAPPASITIPPISLNSTLSLPTQNSTGPAFSNSEDNRSGRFSRTLSSGVALTTGTGGFGNITATPPPFPTGNSTLPSGPTAPLTEACPSPTEFSTITREVVITTYTVETVPVLASTCISSDAAAAAPTSLNGTFPAAGNVTEPTVTLPSVVESLADAISSLTATDAAPTPSEVAPVVSAILSAVSSVASDVTASATSDAASEVTAAPVSRFRRSGTLATQEQIDAACNDTGDLVLSPTLNIQPNNSNEGWFVSQFNPTIPVESAATANGTIARFRSAFPGQTAALSQPLTLCPGTQYDLTASTRQADSRSGCTVQLRIGSNSVFTASPETTFTSRTEQFTAGPGAEGASVDLTLVMSCAGFAGAVVGADPEGYMVGEIESVSVTPAQ